MLSGITKVIECNFKNNEFSKFSFFDTHELASAMFSGNFIESKQAQILIEDTSAECFMAFLEYLYTCHSPIEDSNDSIGILVLANRYGTPRLLSLCELYISKTVERETSQSILNADIDVIGLL